MTLGGPLFDIHFLTGPKVDPEGWQHAEAELVIGTYRERLRVDLGTWSIEDYSAQWRKAIRRLVDGQEHSRLLTSYRGPSASYHFSWPIWREGERIYLQEALILSEQLASSFEPDAAWDIVTSRDPEQAGSTWVSEWEVSADDLVAWLSRPSPPLVSA